MPRSQSFGTFERELSRSGRHQKAAKTRPLATQKGPNKFFSLVLSHFLRSDNILLSFLLNKDTTPLFGSYKYLFHSTLLIVISFQMKMCLFFSASNVYKNNRDI
jgi:hypothetical protein